MIYLQVRTDCSACKTEYALYLVIHWLSYFGDVLLMKMGRHSKDPTNGKSSKLACNVGYSAIVWSIRKRGFYMHFVCEQHFRICSSCGSRVLAAIAVCDNHSAVPIQNTCFQASSVVG